MPEAPSPRPPAVLPPAWLVLLLAVMAFAFQGTRGLEEPDEGRYTAAGIRMLESGDWLVPTLDGDHPHLTKPPITYWAIAAGIGVFGYDEWAARLPSALAYLGTGLLVFGLGRRLVPARPWLPSLVWCLSLAPLAGGNVVSSDAPLTLFETAAMLAFVEDRWRGERPERGRVRAMWIAWGLAFMTKGPPGLLPLVAVIVFLAVHERRSLRPLLDATGLVLFAGVAFTWFGVLVAQEPGRLGYFLHDEVYDRIFTDTHHRDGGGYGGLAVYLPVLVLGALPWTALALVTGGGPRAALGRLVDRLRARDRECLLLAWWFLLPLAVFFLARSRLPLYVLPLFVPLSLGVARSLAADARLTARRLAWTAGLTACALLAAKGVSAYWPSDRDARRIAGEIRRLLDPREIDEIAFVEMPPFHGLSLYLHTHAERVRIGGRRLETSPVAPQDDLCAELAERERIVYAVKESHEPAFVAGVRLCGAHGVDRLGDVHGDGNTVALYRVTPAGGDLAP